MKFKVLEKINPRDPKGQKKFYASIIIEGEFTLDDMAKEIVSFTSLSEADVNSVLIAVQTVAQKKLADGKIVRLGKLGNLYPALSSDGEEKAEDVSVKSIKAVGINYRAGDELIKAMEDAPKQKE